jgi:hypothetical protein
MGLTPQGKDSDNQFGAIVTRRHSAQKQSDEKPLIYAKAR